MNGRAVYAAPLKGLGRPRRVLLLLVPNRAHLALRPFCAGNPNAQRALRLAGAEVQVLRVCCLCQGRRLKEEGFVSELMQSGRTAAFQLAAPAASAETAAAALSQRLAWAEAAEATEPPESQSVLVISADAFIPERWCQMQLVDGEPCPLLWAKQLLAAPASPLLLLGEPGGTEGYALSPRLLHELRSCDNQVQPSAQQMIAQLCSLAKAIHPGPVACAGLLTHRPSARPAPPLPRPLLRSKRMHDGIKVVVITLAHRADRRVEPLVGSPASLAALRHAGFEVEVLRASCYCERDALEQYGRLPCFFGDLWAEFRRYEGADKPLDSEEEEELLEYVNENYNHGAERLVDPDDGDLAGYLRDTNWPGATSCAMSHLRALVKSALDGHEFTLICEDDAVIPTEVAKKRGWCEGCEGKLCFCPTAWVCCVQEAVELMRRAPHLDLLYLGVGEAFEPHGEEILAADSDSEDDLGGTWDNGAWLHVVRGRLSELFLSSMFEESQGEGNRLVLGPEITSHVLALTLLNLHLSSA
ncbi:unnamed protein product [Effrenium voratum]|uniref:Uncharacterized protein n=1 Tax=Effrenium voratum TaxID=2562239 RepID=A0AA36HNV0_9DINO|nr:unnamed protein product [Effrenium voratum]